MRNAQIYDFRGGYNSQDPNETIRPDQLAIAQNGYWNDNGFTQRGGHRPYATGTFLASDVIMGTSERVYLNSGWWHIVALDDAVNGEVRFYRQSTTTLTVLSTSVVFTQGIKVIFTELNGKIVACNGTDLPVVIYYSGGWTIEAFEAHDVRTWGDTSWNAGQYVDSGPTYTDDTTDAQDTDADDFQLGNTTNNDGFWIASVNPFTKVTLESAEQAGGAPVASYQYYSDTGWKTLTLTTTPTWTAAAGDRTMEWGYLSDMVRYDSAVTGIENYFVIRVRFTTAASGAFSCDRVYVYHTHYLSEILEGSVPSWCASYGSRLWFVSGYISYMTPPNDITGIRGLSESEYFLRGGPEIRALAPMKEYLVVFKDTFVYAYFGNSVDTFYRKEVGEVGLDDPLAWVATEQGVFFLSSDGIYLCDGNAVVRVSRHIESDILSWDHTGANAVYFHGKVFFSFPEEDIVLWFEPASLSVNADEGEGRVSFFQFTSYTCDYFIACDGNGDTGYLLAAVNTSQPYIARLENGATDQARDMTAASITWTLRTAYLASGNLGRKKAYGKFALKLHRAAAATTYTFTLYADKGARSKSATISVTTGSGDHVERGRIPYEIDGYNLAFEVSNAAATDAGFTGIAYEYEFKEM